MQNYKSSRRLREPAPPKTNVSIFGCHLATYKIYKSRRLKTHQMGLLQWMKVRQEFVKYCIAEDKILNKLPTHPDYASQIQLRIAFKRWLG